MRKTEATTILRQNLRTEKIGKKEKGARNQEREGEELDREKVLPSKLCTTDLGKRVDDLML